MARYCIRENEPLKKWNGVPIYLTTILTALFVAGLVVSAVLQSARSPLLAMLIFGLPGELTNVFAAFTYPFVGQVSFFTPLGILCFYWWSVGIETHLGRRVLATLLLLLTLVPVAYVAVLHYGFGIAGGVMGNYLLTAGLLIAFSTLYPKLEFAGWIPFKWLAFACLFCGSLMQLAERDWLTLVNLWLCAGTGFLYIRHCLESEQDDAVPVLARVRSWFRRKPRLRVMPSPTPPVRSASVKPRAVEHEPEDSEIDALLDKIAKSGLASLTNTERAKLERARQELLKKERA